MKQNVIDDYNLLSGQQKADIKSVEERAIGQDVMSSLTPGQMVIKIVNEEMISLML